MIPRLHPESSNTSLNSTKLPDGTSTADIRKSSDLPKLPNLRKPCLSETRRGVEQSTNHGIQKECERPYAPMRYDTMSSNGARSSRRVGNSNAATCTRRSTPADCQCSRANLVSCIGPWRRLRAPRDYSCVLDLQTCSEPALSQQRAPHGLCCRQSDKHEAWRSRLDPEPGREWRSWHLESLQHKMDLRSLTGCTQRARAVGREPFTATHGATAGTLKTHTHTHTRCYRASPPKHHTAGPLFGVIGAWETARLRCI